jgi:ketosteroid isomerase-like protein
MAPSKRDILGGALIAAAASASAGRSDAAQTTAAAGDPPFPVWLAITAATQGYADCLDRFDMPGLIALFSPDCVYDYAPGLVMKGRDEVEAGARKSLAGVVKSSHFIGPAVVEAGDAPGTFKSTVYFMAYHQQKDGGQHTVYGRYLDVFKADASGRWLIAHRRTLGHAAEGTTAPRYWLPRLPS